MIRFLPLITGFDATDSQVISQENDYSQVGKTVIVYWRLMWSQMTS